MVLVHSPVGEDDDVGPFFVGPVHVHHQPAQVTNPPIDAIREEIVTDTTVYVGPSGNLLEAPFL